MTKKEEIALTDKQLKGLSNLGEIDIEKFIKNYAPKKCSLVGRFFMWVDDNILSKTTRLWMYLLEIAGIIFIYTILEKVKMGLGMIAGAQTDIDLKKAQLYINSIVSLAPAIATMVATICGALPVIMGVFRSLKKKWKVPEKEPTTTHLVE